MDINVIYDSRRTEKWMPLVKTIGEQTIDVDIIVHDAILDKTSVIAGISKAHQSVVQYAKDRGMPFILIAEDDLWFPSSGGLEYFLDKMPESFDIYLASTYVLPVEENIVCGLHLYMVSSKFYDKFLSIPNNIHIDEALDNMRLAGECDAHICVPFAALQRAGFSSNNAAYCDYNKKIPKELVYEEYF